MKNFPGKPVLFRNDLPPGAAVTVLLVCLIVFGSIFCQNPFATRDPEEPVTSQTSWIQPVSPETVLDNLVDAIREKSVDNYIRCFGGTESVRAQFQFIPEISVSNHYQGVFTGWNIFHERNYLNHLFGQLPQDSLSSLILNDVTEFHYGDSVSTMKDYELHVSHTNQAVASFVTGRLEMTLKKGQDALWYISYWADFRIGEGPVWSILKAEF